MQGILEFSNEDQSVFGNLVRMKKKEMVVKKKEKINWVPRKKKAQKKDSKEIDDKGLPEEKEEHKKDINEMDEPEYDDDQIDPHHGNQPELPEPEPMDLPDDLQLDEGQENDANQEENPFDIDTMKEQNTAEENIDKDENNPDDNENDEEKDFSSDDEQITKRDGGESEANEEEGQNSDKTEDRDEPETQEAKIKDNTEANDDVEETDLDQSQTNQENVEAMEVDNADATDKTQPIESEIQTSSQPTEEICQEDKPDKEGVGQSQIEESKTGHSAQTNIAQQTQSSEMDFKKSEMKQKPGESNLKRSLGDINAPVKKKLKTIDAKDSGEETLSEDQNTEDREVDIYQHVKEANETSTQVLDVATKEQAEQQKNEIPNKGEENDEEPTESSTDLPAEEEPEDVDMIETPTEQPIKTDGSRTRKVIKGNILKVIKLKLAKCKLQHIIHLKWLSDVLKDIHDIEIEGDVVETSTKIPRSIESTHYTQYNEILETTATRLSIEEINSLRSEVENQLSAWNEPPSTTEAEQAWQKISSVTSSLAQDLSEQLRLVLEPTRASSLRGRL
ncbi:hypothetical protein NQ317_000251 [Molorchus minor]|uniref:Uncharacterized protein n=1 Tax=Molorchus minor TaxID=1323400 RepID=A0ABQ9JCB6_9CUCU|nr:hypothetical protein NQ317_000251 [Molorchus minor]